MKLPTERQMKRRAAILSAARKLITERGLNGVTMRDLAAESGVALRTLYQTFGDKNSLLRAAIEERFSRIYGDIESAQCRRGVDRFLFILDAVKDMTLAHADYARALAPMLLAAENTKALDEIRYSPYRRSIQQIDDDGDLAPWADIDLSSSIVRQQVQGIYTLWARDQIADESIGDIAKLAGAATLSSMTTGRTQKQLQAISIKLAQKYRGLRFF